MQVIGFVSLLTHEEDSFSKCQKTAVMFAEVNTPSVFLANEARQRIQDLGQEDIGEKVELHAEFLQCCTHDKAFLFREIKVYNGREGFSGGLQLVVQKQSPCV